MPDDPNVQKAIADFYQGGTSYQAPSDWSARVGPLTTLLAYHGPGGFQELGLPLPKAPTPNAMTQPEVRRAYEDWTAALTQYDTAGRHLVNPRTGEIDLAPDEYSSGLGQLLKALSENIASWDKTGRVSPMWAMPSTLGGPMLPALSAEGLEAKGSQTPSDLAVTGSPTLPEDLGALTLRDDVDATKRALYEDVDEGAEKGYTEEEASAIEIPDELREPIKRLMFDPRTDTPRKAKTWLINPDTNFVWDEILQAWGGDPNNRESAGSVEARMRLWAVIDLLDLLIGRGYEDKWPSEFKVM